MGQTGKDQRFGNHFLHEIMQKHTLLISLNWYNLSKRKFHKIYPKLQLHIFFNQILRTYRFTPIYTNIHCSTVRKSKIYKTILGKRSKLFGQR